MALAGGNGVFFPCEHDLHKAIGFFGQKGADIVCRTNFASAAKGAANGYFSDLNLVQGDLKGIGQRF